VFDEGRTPKVVIMGITTSRSAKDNFRADFGARSSTELSFDETLMRSSIANTFNSGLPLFHRNLSKIIELSGIHTIIGIEAPVTINEHLFRKYVNGKCSNDEEKLLKNVYFSQAVVCSSCESGGGNKALGQQDIDDHHKKCLNAQVEIVESFHLEVDLWISLGMTNPITVDSEGHLEHTWLQRRMAVKCKNFVNITNVGGAAPGWTQMEVFQQMLSKDPSIDRDGFVSKVDERFRDNKSRFRTQVRKCAKQLMELRDIAKNLALS
jgi:hypothetical protein